MSFPIPEPIARLLSKVGPELISDLFTLIEKALTSPDPKDAIARATQVLAHEKGAEAAVAAMFAGKNKIAGTGE